MLISLNLSLVALAEIGNAPTLVSDSPFLPPGFQPPGNPSTPVTPPATSSQYEFRGVYQLGGVYHYNLYNVRERKASWVTKQDTGDTGLEILSFDPEENALALEAGGETLSLTLIATSNTTLPVQTAPATPAVNPATPATKPATTTSVRRRVIRPTTRTGSSNSSTAPARRRIIRPTN
jgi:hypothetical protein